MPDLNHEDAKRQRLCSLDNHMRAANLGTSEAIYSFHAAPAAYLPYLARLHAIIEMMCDAGDIDRNVFRRHVHQLRCDRAWLGGENAAFPAAAIASQPTPASPGLLWIPEAFYDVDGPGFRSSADSWCVHRTCDATVLSDDTSGERCSDSVPLKEGETVGFLWAKPIASVGVSVRGLHDYTIDGAFPETPRGTDLIYAIKKNGEGFETTSDALIDWFATSSEVKLPDALTVHVLAVGVESVPLTWNGQTFVPEALQ
ncbi:hypothetical protein [Kozakia baliensis]|nr:hypothetical protein [Kozakia baliensis]